jgi:1,4-alpha-glucan branching enzyme
MVTSGDLEKITRVEHPEPHGVLGPHAGDGALFVRVFRPGATGVRIVPDGAAAPRAASLVHPGGIFEAVFPGASTPFPYRVEARQPGGAVTSRDPYAFPPGLGDLDDHLFAEGTHEQIYRHLGAHLREISGVRGTRFAVWAPFASSVSVAGDWNGWDGRMHAMTRGKGGVWEIFVPDVLAGALYKLEVRTGRGLAFMKADPFGRAMELRPNNASKVHESHHVWSDDAWIEARAQADPRRRPMSIYEVHLGSWRRRERPGAEPSKDPAAGWMTYRELAKELLDYVVEMGFTHVELLPVMEHPYDG